MVFFFPQTLMNAVLLLLVAVVTRNVLIQLVLTCVLRYVGMVSRGQRMAKHVLVGREFMFTD